MNKQNVRNEFGLSKEHAVDVQKDRAKDMLPRSAVVVGLLAAFALMMIVLPNMPGNNGSHVPPTSPITGSVTR